MQVHWLRKAVDLQQAETHQSLRRLIPEIALTLNRMGHDLFHGDSLTINLVDMREVERRVDSILLVHNLPASPYLAFYQDSVGGLFLSNRPEEETVLRASDIRACMSCIVSFSISRESDKLPEEKEENFRKRVMKNADFQYFSSVDRMTKSPGKVLWVSLYQPDTLSAALQNLMWLFLANVLLLLLLLFLFFYLIRSLTRHKRLSQVKDDFFSNMTHEFKTPLSSIRLASRVLRQSQDPAKNLRYHQLIEKESAQLERQIDKLLDLSLLDHGELRLDWEEMDLAEVLPAISRRLAPLIESKGAQVQVEVPTPLLLRGDRDHLLNSLGNLVENSLKYSPEGVRIWLSASQEGKKTLIRVRDDGPGIKAADQAHIFDRFYRAQARNQYKGPGFGIGLSYVKSIVEAHGGTIELRSEAGAGCEFILRL
jgi:signal transduction histidine kinase